MTTHQLELSTLERKWIDASAATVLQLMRGAEFTSDDLHSVLEPPAHDGWWGALMARLRNTGKIERVGYRASERPERNGGVVRVWRLK